MIDPGSDFYVVTIGRRFVRILDCCIVCRSLDQAQRYESSREARAAARELAGMLPKGRRASWDKPIGIQRVRVDAVTWRRPGPASS